MTITRNNHFVPEWYQYGFIPKVNPSYFRLDLEPHKVQLPNGTVKEWTECRPFAPSQCFYQTDLYTTFFGVPNDDIEKMLFGEIDNTGAKGLQAVIDHDMHGLSLYFQNFFEYMDVQKLRTPKGLDWIRSKYRQLDQVQLMREMQAIRLMHCPMWSEAVREIVSAEDSDIKFIVTDHPVTIYNQGCPPDSVQCKYPNEPSIALKGSQTVFPLDLNHCLVLTNLEYAKNPTGTNPIEPRTNARNRGDTILSFAEPTSKRRIGADEVKAINFLLKNRAKRYIAGAKKDWLNPPTISWVDIGKILLPPENILWKFGGEIYVGFNDKSSRYQDAYGRSVGLLPHLIKEPATDQRGPILFNIRERNMMFYNAVLKILGLDSGKVWLDVRKELTDEQVKKIHSAYASLWPVDTNLVEMLPKPDENVFRAVYMGLVDPRTVSKSVMGFLPYVDEIIVVNPFANAGCIRPEYSPLNIPAQYKQETLKNVLFLIQMAPFIEMGIVNLIPDPFDFNFAFREEVFAMASERLKGWKSDEYVKEMEPILRDDHEREMNSMPAEFLKRVIRKTSPELNDTQVDNVIKVMKNNQYFDSLSLLQPVVLDGKWGHMMKMSLSPNLEIGLYLAQVTGSFLYTDNHYRWTELVASAKSSDNKPYPAHLESLIKQVNDLVLNIEAHAEIQLDIRKSKKFEGLRMVLRKVWKLNQVSVMSEQISEETNRLIGELESEVTQAENEWELLYKEFKRTAKIPPSEKLLTFDGRLSCTTFLDGLGHNTVYRLLVTYGGTNYSTSMPMALYVETALK